MNTGMPGLIPRLLGDGSGNKSMVWYIDKRCFFSCSDLWDYHLEYNDHAKLPGICGNQTECVTQKGKDNSLQYASAHSTFSMKTQLSEKF